MDPHGRTDHIVQRTGDLDVDRPAARAAEVQPLRQRGVVELLAGARREDGSMVDWALANLELGRAQAATDAATARTTWTAAVDALGAPGALARQRALLAALKRELGDAGAEVLQAELAAGGWTRLP
jgi:hypothetical protein